ncbi:MAG: paraquat-inducible protein A [Candidatus Accumulibacter sp.]|jgi:paraquat-inducible protein A|nr:paraquat-inducible protein A [Accumulibacter sp.]
MKTFSDLIVCEHCDSVYRRRPLAAGEAAQCGRCAAILYRARRYDVDHWLALTLAAAITFVIANVCPIIRIGFQGMRNDATLWDSASALAQGPITIIAAPFALSIIVLPCAQIGLLAWVLVYARAGRRAPGFAPAMRALAALRPWSMVEVCLLGILVAVVKLSHFLQVAPGAGFWAMAGLMVLITLIANRDVHRLWELTEPRPPLGAEE